MDVKEINKDFLDELFAQAKENPRLRQNFDLRTSMTDTSQRMLNALLPGTVVPIHRHEETTETVVCLCGKMEEVIYSHAPSPSPTGEGSDVYCGMNAQEMPCGMDAQDVCRPRMEFVETERILLCPREGRYGCQIPRGAWHTVNVIEPSVIFEAKDGAYKMPIQSGMP